MANTEEALLRKIQLQLISINNSVLRNRENIRRFQQSGNKTLLVVLRKQLKFINTRVLVNQHTIGTKLVLSRKKFDKNALNWIQNQLKIIFRNMVLNQRMILRLLACSKYDEATKKQFRLMLKQIKLIKKNLVLSIRIVDGLIQPPPVSCPSGHICVPIRLIPGLSLELDIDPKAVTITISLKVYGVSVFSGTISLSNPTLTIGGEFGLFFAALSIRMEFGQIAQGHFRIILSGRACIGPPIDFLRDCTEFNQIIYDQ